MPNAVRRGRQTKAGLVLAAVQIQVDFVKNAVRPVLSAMIGLVIAALKIQGGFVKNAELLEVRN